MLIRELPRWLMMALLLAPSFGGTQEIGYREAVGRLAQERTLAESCASILKTFADDDPMARIQGQRLYARAKADVDGLIAMLVVDLAGDRSPADIPELSQRLAAVPAQRRTFCQHVDTAVGADVRAEAEDTRDGLLAALLAEAVGSAAGSLIEAGVDIWKEYRRADEVRRQTIAAQIEAQRWLPFAEVPKS